MSGGPNIFGLNIIRRGTLAVAVLAALPLAACVSDETAVDMGLATSCDAKNVVSSVGDPARRYVSVQGGESCKGPRRHTYDTRTLALLDCTMPARLDIKVSQLAVDTAARGPNYDHSKVVDTQTALLRIGLTDLAGVSSALNSAGVPATLSSGVTGEECTKRA